VSQTAIRALTPCCEPPDRLRRHRAFAAMEVVGRSCAYRKSSPSILVMQSTQDRPAQNAPRCLGGT
jgi:hypothetical protein